MKAPLHGKGYVFNEWGDFSKLLSNDCIDNEIGCVRICLIQFSRWLIDITFITVERTDNQSSMSQCQKKKITSAHQSMTRWCERGKKACCSASSHQAKVSLIIFELHVFKQTESIMLNCTTRACDKKGEGKVVVPPPQPLKWCRLILWGSLSHRFSGKWVSPV